MSGFDYKPINITKPEVSSYSNSSSSGTSFNDKVKKMEVETVEMDMSQNVNEVKYESIPIFTEKKTAVNIVDKGDYMGIAGDYDQLIDIFGGQHDDHGIYGRQNKKCHYFARGYAIYLQTGKIASFGDMTDTADGMVPVEYDAKSRKEQAEFAYKMVKEEGKPCIVHVNSSHIGSGKGHWLCVVGYKKGVTLENVTIGDLVVIDSDAERDVPITAKVRFVSEDSYYCIEGFERCTFNSGYQIYYYNEE